ncbi:MAG: class I SAM-dependent methyltransferase [Anaerovoracaceae bacterium]
MNNLITKPTELSLNILSEYISKGDIVIDATAGNGHDTLALAKLVGLEGTVYAFDIQEIALQKTKTLLEQEGYISRCILILDSHNHMKENIPYSQIEKISAVIFNLGYLPNEEKRITTTLETTLPAVKQALELIKVNGVVAITMYDGHPSGKAEKEGLLKFSKELPAKEYHAAYISLINQKNQPPELIFITKKKSIANYDKSR